MPHRLSRQEIFELVWSQPIKQLAEKFGLSDVAIAKKCRHAAVPLPQRGYWAKCQAGKRTTQPALPPRPPGLSDTIVLGSSRYYWVDTLTEAEILGPVPPAPVFPERISAVIGKVPVPRSFVKAHRLIARLLEEDERRREKQRSTPYPSSWDNPLFDSPFERRRFYILNALFIAMERASCKPDIRGKEARELSVTVGSSHVNFTLDRPAVHRPRLPKSSDRQKDILRLEIRRGYHNDNARAAWQDADNSPLESNIQNIAIGIVVTGEEQYRESAIHSHKWRIERKAQLEEEARRSKREAEEKERRRQAKIEGDRIDRLLAEATALRQANEIRTYVGAVCAAKTAPGISENELEAWADWALVQADRSANMMDPEHAEYIVVPCRYFRHIQSMSSG